MHYAYIFSDPGKFFSPLVMVVGAFRVTVASGTREGIRYLAIVFGAVFSGADMEGLLLCRDPRFQVQRRSPEGVLGTPLLELRAAAFIRCGFHHGDGTGISGALGSSAFLSRLTQHCQGQSACLLKAK